MERGYKMKNELLISVLKYECDDFANKLMDMFKGVRVEFSVYDEDERFQDAIKDKQDSPSSASKKQSKSKRK